MGIVNVIINLMNGIIDMCNTINTILNSPISLGIYGQQTVIEVLFGGALAIILAYKLVRWILG